MKHLFAGEKGLALILSTITVEEWKNKREMDVVYLSKT